MNNDIKEIKIVTIGDIFENLQTEEQALKFLCYITNLQEENKRLEENPLRGMFANITDDELLIDMGYTNKENEELKQRIDKAIEVIDLIKPELWNISNKMTYRLIDIKNILKGSKDNDKPTN